MEKRPVSQGFMKARKEDTTTGAIPVVPVPLGKPLKRKPEEKKK